MPTHTKVKYGITWDFGVQDLDIEMTCIQSGGKWEHKGRIVGEGLFYHYKELQKLLWPEDDHHRWSDLVLEEVVKNTITVVQGPKDSGKTNCALVKFGLSDYWCFPNNTLILISSTDVRGLELRVWGELKTYFARARARFPWLTGHLIDSKHAIATQNVKEDDVRDLRKGIVCIPCMSTGGSWLGLGKYIGIKQARRRLLGDEAQAMRPPFLDAIANLNSGNFKGVFCGNPIGEGDPLDKLAEPKGGWGTEGDIKKTTVWENRFLNGRTVNLVGTDSPNFDFPQDQPPRYPYLIHKDSIERVVSFYGTDSVQYYAQCLGVRRAGINARRVITRQLCKKFGAMHPAVWLHDRRTRIYGCDAAYRGVGGDRCVVGWIEFGPDVNGQIIMRVNPPKIVPVNVAIDESPEDQIVEFIRNDCEENDIPSANIFYDATGRGSLGAAFARLYTAAANPVEFGGSPTERPVSLDLFIYDEEMKMRRLKRCDEEYSKFVTELWFSWRWTIESGQMRELPEDVMEEGCLREWGMTKGNKVEIEPKSDTKERMGRSPDLADWLVTCIEGARRKGFQISKLAAKNQPQDDSWKDKLRSMREKFKKSHELDYAV